MSGKFNLILDYSNIIHISPGPQIGSHFAEAFVFFSSNYFRSANLCHLQHKLIGFYNRDEKCLQRGTDWGFK